MSIDKKAFGLSDSLVSAVNEALKGGQKKIDVAPPFGKLTGADFKKLRGEDKDKEQAIANEQSPGEYEKANFKHGMLGTDKKMKNEAVSDVTVSEAAAVGAPVPNMAATMDARKAQVQRTIAQKQAAFQKAKANKRIAGTVKEAHKCSCGETNESKMKCEVHGGPKNRQMVKGGKEQIVMNPPLKEASDLPKKVVTKGHEIAKSLIKHRAKVKSPYAVGMATAKKSAGIKEDAEHVDEGNPLNKQKKNAAASAVGAKNRDSQYLDRMNPAVADKIRGREKMSGVDRKQYKEDVQVDELSNKTLYRYGHKAHNQVVRTNIMGLAKRTGGVGMKNAALKLKNRKAGVELAHKKAQAKKD